MKWGVVGYGSVGRRHVQNILKLNDECVVFTKATDCPVEKVNSISELLKKNCDQVVIANATSKHFETYSEIRKISKTIPVLIEKPLFDKSYNVADNDPNAFVAYCMRYHAVTLKLKKLLQNKKVISAQFYVGQYLPDWRPNRNYSETYSAKKSEGGGVLRDLSHEIDLADYLLGGLNLNYSFSKKLSNLQIDSDDTYLGIFYAQNCPLVSVQMNYLDRIKQRNALFITDDQTIKADFIAGIVQVNNDIENVSTENYDMYLEMLKDFKSEKSQVLCSFKSGVEIIRLIEKSEKGHL